MEYKIVTNDTNLQTKRLCQLCCSRYNSIDQNKIENISRGKCNRIEKKIYKYGYVRTGGRGIAQKKRENDENKIT